MMSYGVLARGTIQSLVGLMVVEHEPQKAFTTLVVVLVVVEVHLDAVKQIVQ
jgi:hypothetical protein